MAMETLKKVGSVYLETESVKETADRCGISEVKARRILITLGMWSSPSSEQIRELCNAGKSVKDIAAELCISEKAVEAYLPYRKGVYGLDEKSAVALRTELCRNRKSIAAENMRKMEESMMDMSRSWEEIRRQQIEEEKQRFKVEDYKSLIFTENDDGESPQKPSFAVGPGAALHLHLELVESEDFSASEKKLAKVENSISRDVLVPGSMTLHQMHYMIQKLFGWQNSHLHHFELDKEDFDLVTAGRFGPFADLCGTLFRFPEVDDADEYWDDDYDGTVSFKSWLKQKYSHTRLNQSICDTWFGGQMGLKQFRERHPNVTDDMFLLDVNEEAGFDRGYNQLSERVSVKEMFTHKADRQSVRSWKGAFVSSLQSVEDEWADIDHDEMMEAMEQLRKWRKSYSDWKQAMWMRPDETKKLVQKHYRMSIDKLLKEHTEAIDVWAYTIYPVSDECNPTLQPYFESINYSYDYGDGWQVRITLVDTYEVQVGEEYETLSAAFDAHPTSKHITAKDIGLDEADIMDASEIEEGPWALFSALGGKEAMERYRYFDSAKKEADGEMRQKLATVHIKGTPICIGADGLNVLDDCGGVSGFIDMLQTIYGKDKDESASMRARANGMGWTGRKTKPENML